MNLNDITIGEFGTSTMALGKSGEKGKGEGGWGGRTEAKDDHMETELAASRLRQKGGESECEGMSKFRRSSPSQCWMLALFSNVFR